MHDYNMNNWNMPGMGWIFWIILIGLVIWFVFHNIAYSKNRRGSLETPLEILKRRYAEGEITKEEYEEKKKVIEQDR